MRKKENKDIYSKNGQISKLINHYSRKGIPFVFLIDYRCSDYFIKSIDEINPGDLLFDFNGFSNLENRTGQTIPKIEIEKKPVSFSKYSKAFDIIQDGQKDGYSYLANLTFPTEIKINLSLKEIYLYSRAKYKIWYKDLFVVFSPETFITIKDNIISSHPMKGTIDAAIPDAEKVILNDEKETAEHITIVDLIRNDLSIIADDVTVEKYRYIDKLNTSFKTLLQVSSKINGALRSDYKNYLGDIILKILPAGSITGAPKKRTIELIEEAEKYSRGFYTGICGYFDGDSLDSGVLIRFIERINGKLFYKSGGGITIYSDVKSEYQEMIDKVYVPFS